MSERRGVTQLEGLSVEREVRIDASPDTVFEFFTDPGKMTRWKGSEAQLDPRPGGVYRVNVIPGSVAVGEYTLIDRPREIAFTWGWEGEGQPVPPGSSLVHVTFIPDGEGTIVRLRHSGLPSDEMVDAHTQGWDHFLYRLAIAARGGDPGPDTYGAGD